MLKFFDMAFLAIFAHSAYRAIHARVWWKFLIELIFIAIGASSSLLFTGIVQNGFTYNDAVAASSFIALAWGWIYMTRRLTLKFKRNHDSYQESYRSFLKQADFLASESSRIDHAIPHGIMSEIAELSTVAELTRRRLVAVKRRVKMFGIFIGVSIGFLVAFFILPNLARYEAIYSARNNIAEWRAPNGTNPSRIPVYWTGDRIVYITNDGKECLVHLQIASVEQAIRSCPEVITDASAPKK
jgi:hypothetical protein